VGPAAQVLTAGQAMKLPNGEGKLTFVGYKQWISIQETHDPGQFPALIYGVVALAGLVLSFRVRRRRIFVRAYGDEAGRTTVDVAGLGPFDVGRWFERGVAGLVP